MKTRKDWSDKRNPKNVQLKKGERLPIDAEGNGGM
jgi:hypothetical protein